MLRLFSEKSSGICSIFVQHIELRITLYVRLLLQYLNNNTPNPKKNTKFESLPPQFSLLLAEHLLLHSLSGSLPYFPYVFPQEQSLPFSKPKYANPLSCNAHALTHSSCVTDRKVTGLGRSRL